MKLPITRLNLRAKAHANAPATLSRASNQGSALMLMIWAILVMSITVISVVEYIRQSTLEATQAAYRLGDSTTNMITPFMTYFPLILIMAQKYRPDFGIGSMIALMLPYTIAVFLASTTLFTVWYMLDLPYGPGVTREYVPSVAP